MRWFLSRHLRRCAASFQIVAILLLHGYGLAPAWHTACKGGKIAVTRHCCQDHVCRCTVGPDAARHCCCGMPPGDDADDPAGDDDSRSFRSLPCGDDDSDLLTLEKLKYLPVPSPTFRACAAPNLFNSRYAMVCPSRAIEPQVPPPRLFSA